MCLVFESVDNVDTLSEKCKHFSEVCSPAVRLPFGKALAG